MYLFLFGTTSHSRSIISAIVPLFIICATPAFAANPEIDLKGRIINVEGHGIGQAVVTLVAAGLADTSDSIGNFHLLRTIVALSEHPPVQTTFSKGETATVIEFFDISGRLLKCQTIGGNRSSNPRQSLLLSRRMNTATSLVLLRVRNSACAPCRPVVRDADGTYTGVSRNLMRFAKKTSVADTLVINRDGYHARRLVVTEYLQNLDTITLRSRTTEDLFDIRNPAERAVQCIDPWDESEFEMTFWDTDLLCDCFNDSLQATIYFQSRPDSCTVMFSPVYAVENAWIRIGDTVEPLGTLHYDWGGNHHNDRIVFSWNGRYYGLYHSSIGIGARACARPDCMQLCGDAECRTILYDGCERAACQDQPALKVNCVQVRSDGTVPERLDPWTSHEGDDDYPLLPCNGDSRCE